MQVQLTDRIEAKPRGSVDAAMAYAKRMGAYDLMFVLAFFTELWRLCVALGWDFAILVAQSKNETDAWRSGVWKEFRNPAGLAVTNKQNLSLVYKTGEDAARAFCVHWWVYLHGALKSGDLLYQWRDLDGHYQQAVDGINTKESGGDGKPFAGSVKTLGDLNVNGRWALLDRENTPAPLPLNDYGNRIRKDAIEVWGDSLQAQATGTGGGTVAKDPFDLIRDIAVSAPVRKTAEGQGFNYGVRDAVALCQHETQGIMGGFDRQKFFSVGGERGLDAMVDYGAARDGKIYIFNDPYTSNMIPWASGGGAAGANRNNADGKAVDNKYGNLPGGVNRVYAAVEVEKEDDGRMNAAQIPAVARLTAYTCAKEGYPANDWKYPDALGGNIPTSVDHDVLSMGTNCEQHPADRAAFEALVGPLLADFYGTGGSVGTDSGDPPTSGPVTPPANTDILAGVDQALAKEWFGKLVYGGATYQYNPDGPITQLWIERGKQTAQWPQLVKIKKYDTRTYYFFADSAVAMVAKGQPARWMKQ